MYLWYIISPVGISLGRETFGSGIIVNYFSIGGLVCRRLRGELVGFFRELGGIYRELAGFFEGFSGLFLPAGDLVATLCNYFLPYSSEQEPGVGVSALIGGAIVP